MNILMTLSNPFTHDPRVHREAKTLMERGHNVTVLAWDRKGAQKPNDNKDGIGIIRVFNSRLADLMLNRKEAFDLVHCHDLDTLPIGVRLKKKLGLPLIYDSHEIWPYMIEGEVPNVLVKRLVNLEKRSLKSVDHVIAVGKSSKGHFEKITDKPVSIVMNCKDLEYDIYEPPKNASFTLIYIGIMSRKRFFPEIVDLIGETEGTRLQLASTKIGLYDEVKERCKKYESTEFLGTIPDDELIHSQKS
jgi:hypothetical protein